MTQDVNVTDYIRECKDDIVAARRRIDQVIFLIILMLGWSGAFMFLYYINLPFIWIGITDSLWWLISLVTSMIVAIQLAWSHGRYNARIRYLEDSIEHVERTAINVDHAWRNDAISRSVPLQHREYGSIDEYRDRQVHEAIEHDIALSRNFDMEYKEKFPDMPRYECPLCNAKLDYFGFYMRNKDAWKGSLRELEEEWLKYDHNNPKNNCSIQLLCCSCHDRIMRENNTLNEAIFVFDEPIVTINEGRVLYNRRINIQPSRNALDMNGNLVDFDFNYTLYGEENKEDRD